MGLVNTVYTIFLCIFFRPNCRRGVIIFVKKTWAETKVFKATDAFTKTSTSALQKLFKMIYNITVKETAEDSSPGVDSYRIFDMKGVKNGYCS